MLTGSGSGVVALPAGRYRMVASHGPEWTIASFEVSVVAGRSTPARFELARVVPTDGYVAADLHQHAIPSNDAAVTLDDRVLSDLAEHVEVAVATDHEAITDYGAAIDRVGARGRLLAIAGDEATTYAIGHFNAWPLTRRPELPRGGAFRSAGRTVAQIVGLFRQDPACRVVQMNHPRVGRIGYLDSVKYDPYGRAPPDGFVASFDAIEVANGKRVDSLEPVLLDGYSLLRRGLRRTATGNSDTHRIVGEEAGWPRTYIGVPSDDLAKLTVEDVASGIADRRDAVVSAGPFLRVRGDGKPPGSTVKVRGRLDYEVEVWAAPWVDVTSLVIVVDGVTAEKLAVPASTAPLRLKHRTRIPFKKDGFVVAVARGERDLAPIVPRLKPFAVANPIWVDADGRAGWTALPPLTAPSRLAAPAAPSRPRRQASTGSAEELTLVSWPRRRSRRCRDRSGRAAGRSRRRWCSGGRAVGGVVRGGEAPIAGRVGRFAGEEGRRRRRSVVAAGEAAG